MRMQRVVQELKLVARLWLTTARVGLRLLWLAWSGDEPPEGQEPAEDQEPAEEGHGTHAEALQGPEFRYKVI
jgi:hypothetical protein